MGLAIAAVIGVSIGGALLAGGWKLRSYLRDSETEWDNWDYSVDLGTADDLAFDEAEHVKARRPKLTLIPDGFTCLDCRENDALPSMVWCAVCAERYVGYPSMPVDGGQR